MGKSNIDLSSVTTVGLDLAKHVFQVHCVDASGRVVVAALSWRHRHMWTPAFGKSVIERLCRSVGCGHMFGLCCGACGRWP